MNDTPQPFAFADTAAMTPEVAKAEQGRTLSDASFQRMLNGGGAGAREKALGYLEALGKAQTGQPASPAPQHPQNPQQAAHDAMLRRSAADGGEQSPLTAEQQAEQDAAAAEAFAPRNADDYRNNFPDGSHPFAAEWRAQFFEDRVPPSAVNLIASAPQIIEQAAKMDDTAYFAAFDKAAADVRALPGGRMLCRKAADLIDALPDNHPYRPVAEALMLRPGGISIIAHWSDALRAKGLH